MGYEEEKLEGKKPSQILVQEFWLEGKLQCPCNTVHMTDIEGKCWQLYYDDEYDCWASSLTKEPFPKANSAKGDENFYYPIKELTGSEIILNKIIMKFEAYYSGGLATGDVIFNTGDILRLTHDCDTVSSQYMILSN